MPPLILRFFAAGPLVSALAVVVEFAVVVAVVDVDVDALGPAPVVAEELLVVRILQMYFAISSKIEAC